MKMVVVYDSVYGNTRRIAEVVGDALTGDVAVLPVGQTNAAEFSSAELNSTQLKSVDLLVIGSPTHGALPTEAMQAFVKTLGAPADDSARVATFDTRLSWGFLRKYGFAATKMADQMGEKGWRLQGSPGGFYVKGLKKGPLKKGEVERAASWAKGLVESEPAASG
jgi:flavodoxin